jgi:hypothetical protein
MSNTSGEDTDTRLGAHEDSRPGDDMGRWREDDPTHAKNGAGDGAHGTQTSEWESSLFVYRIRKGCQSVKRFSLVKNLFERNSGLRGNTPPPWNTPKVQSRLGLSSVMVLDGRWKSSPLRVHNQVGQ